MKLLYILDEIRYSGAEIMIAHSAEFFQSKGLELYALSTGDRIGDYSEEMIKAGLSIKHIPFQRKLSFLYQVYQFISEYDFSIVHIHTERAFFYYALIAWLDRVPVLVRTVHNVFMFRGALRIRRLFFRWISTYIFKMKFISVGDSVANTEKRFFNNNSETIYNWVDENRFYPLKTGEEKKSIREKAGLPKNAFIISTVGACLKVKRHEDMIKALAIAVKKHEDIFLIHVGDGELNEKEKELVRKLNITDRVFFLGNIHWVRDALAASDLFVMTSDYEGLSVSSLEALQCGLPMVVYRSPGLVDVVENEKNGLVIQGSYRILAEKIQYLYCRKGLLKEWGKNSFELAQKKFHKERSLQKILNVYRSYVDV